MNLLNKYFTLLVRLIEIILLWVMDVEASPRVPGLQEQEASFPSDCAMVGNKPHVEAKQLTRIDDSEHSAGNYPTFFDISPLDQTLSWITE